MSEKARSGKRPSGTSVARSAVAGRFVAKSDSLAMRIARDPELAEAFLKKAGIIVEAGKLAPEYAALEE